MMRINLFGLRPHRWLAKWLVWILLGGFTAFLVILVSRPSMIPMVSDVLPPGTSQTDLAQAEPAQIDCYGTTAASAPARPLALDELALGTNLNGIADWSTELPFLDGFKSARMWMTQCDPGEPGCSGGWETPERDQLDLDDQGWVRSLPAPEDSPEYTRVGTLLFREIEGHYPGGQYVVLYEGEGTLEYRYDAQKDEAASRPGREVINVTPSGNGIWLQLTATDPNRTGNYLRNIRVVPIAYEDTYATEIFNPVFLERIRSFRALRFMDWMNTNNSEQQDWSDRPQVDDASYAWGKGAPLEVMIALANRIGATPWFNMPHQATDDYLTNFAQSVKTCLDPNLKVYVELSNEVWNWQFSQAHYALEQGQARWGDKGDAFMQWYGMRTAQMSDIWKQVFADQADRVVSIMSTQTPWLGLEVSALDCSLWVEEGNQPCYQHGIDAFAIAGYFSGRLSDGALRETVESWLQEPDGGFDKAFTQIMEGNQIPPGDGIDDTLAGASKYWQHHQQVAQERGLQLIVYEGGQHLVSPDSEALTEFFIALNRDPRMYDAYTELFRLWDVNGGALFMNFVDVSNPSRWGSWGALEYVEQERSPKYDALMEFADRTKAQATRAGDRDPVPDSVQAPVPDPVQRSHPNRPSTSSIAAAAAPLTLYL